MKGNLQFAFQSTYRGNTIQWISGLCLCLAQILSFKYLHKSFFIGTVAEIKSLVDKTGTAKSDGIYV